MNATRLLGFATAWLAAVAFVAAVSTTIIIPAAQLIAAAVQQEAL